MVDSFDWEDIIEWIVLGAIDAHKFHGKGSFHGKESVEECIEDTIEALKDNALSRYEEIKSEEGVHARLKTVQVAVDLESKKSRRLTEEEREILNEYFEE